jgi:hypothetical protein
MIDVVTRVMFGVVMACGAFVPGPCNFDPRRDFDCNNAEHCDENFACAVDGYCKSADVACLDGEGRCEVPGLERVGVCVLEEDLQTSKVHCGGCFTRCLGAGTCIDGACEGAPAAGACLVERGHFDCPDDQVCDAGTCVDGERGDGDVRDACDSDADCRGGLCVDDVCTAPCDFGCAFGFTCDEAAIAGGLCVADDDEVCL